MGSDDASSPEVADLSKALGELVESGKEVRFTNQVLLDREQVYDILDGLRASLPESVKELRWYRKKRQDEGDPPPDSSLVDEPFDVFDRIDGIDDLLHNAKPVPLSASTVRVKRERLEESVGRLQAWLVPFARQLLEYRNAYPELRAQVTRARQQEPSELVTLIYKLEDLVRGAKSIPLTTEKRVEPAQIKDLTTRIRAALFREVDDPSGLRQLIDRIDQIVQSAKAVPLTSQVRVDPEQVTEISEHMMSVLIKLEREKKADS